MEPRLREPSLGKFEGMVKSYLALTRTMEIQHYSPQRNTALLRIINHHHRRIRPYQGLLSEEWWHWGEVPLTSHGRILQGSKI